ncbi:hypothetical protein C2O87_21440 [Salmonella enterica]|nr:hypothetical protein [Salmonella enterica]
MQVSTSTVLIFSLVAVLCTGTAHADTTGAMTFRSGVRDTTCTIGFDRSTVSLGDVTRADIDAYCIDGIGDTDPSREKERKLYVGLVPNTQPVTAGTIKGTATVMFSEE